MSDLSPRERLLQKTRATARERFWTTHDRETYTCPICGGDGPFDVHHRDGDAFNNHSINLIGVCRTCHTAEHRRRARHDRVAEWKDRVKELGVTA